MAIESGQFVNKTDIQNFFKTNVTSIVKSNVYHSSRIPTFSGSAGSANAIPAGDLDAVGNIPDTISITGEIISGTTIYNLMLTVIRNCTRVRNFSSSYKFNNQGNQVTQATSSGVAVFKQSLPSVSSSYDRNKNGSLISNITPANNITNQIGAKDRLTTLCNTMISSWQSVRNDKVVYNYYSCHSSCHSSCHGDRSRR